MGEKPVYELTTETERSINTTGNHPYLVKYKSSAVSFNAPVVGSTVKPSDSSKTTPINTLSNIPVDEFKSVLISAIEDYFSNSPILTTDELKDLIVAYFSTTGEDYFMVKREIPIIPKFIQQRFYELLAWVVGGLILVIIFFVIRERYLKKMIREVKGKEERLEKEFKEFKKSKNK